MYTVACLHVWVLNDLLNFFSLEGSEKEGKACTDHQYRAYEEHHKNRNCQGRCNCCRQNKVVISKVTQYIKGHTTEIFPLNFLHVGRHRMGHLLKTQNNFWYTWGVSSGANHAFHCNDEYILCKRYWWNWRHEILNLIQYQVHVNKVKMQLVSKSHCKLYRSRGD